MISDSSRVPSKKSGELWSTNYRELYVSLNPPKLHFSGDYISATMGVRPSVIHVVVLSLHYISSIY